MTPEKSGPKHNTWDGFNAILFKMSNQMNASRIVASFSGCSAGTQRPSVSVLPVLTSPQRRLAWDVLRLLI